MLRFGYHQYVDRTSVPQVSAYNSLALFAQMRASNQQDLIYKRGQAGVTRASVTIVFDNSDRSKSPTGYEHCKQITVTRQVCKHNIRALKPSEIGYVDRYSKRVKVPSQRAQSPARSNTDALPVCTTQHQQSEFCHHARAHYKSMFLSLPPLCLHLIVNQVLNMRPQEILGLVEEAAGTRMFEERKDKAKKTMSKKDKNVQEYTSLLEEEITPKLNKLREEKRSFLQYQKTCTELERIGRLLRAWEWTDAKKRVRVKETEVETRKSEVKAVKESQGRISREIKAAEEDVKDVMKKRDAEMKKGGKLKLLEDQVASLAKVLVKINTQADIARNTIQDEKSKIIALENEVKEV